MRLVLMWHSLSEWLDVRADQARRVGCSETYITRLRAQLRDRWEQTWKL